ncbi:MAG: Ig-like domain-containing protein [Candidatus Eiseniibacteriota bacterium]|nr:MAG: Ig-like domain-containing protein [Candidatus Eisenbacteria bacterium]
MSPGRVTSVATLVFVVLLVVSLGGCSEKSSQKPERDNTPPELVSATAVDEIHLNVTFNEKLDETSAEDAGNYTITPSLVHAEATGLLPVVSGVLLQDGENVLLETDPQLGFDYILEVSGVKDLAGNAMSAQTTEFSGSTQSDTTSPVVTRTIPADGAWDVDTLTTVTIEFSERMNTGSVESNFEILEGPFGGYSLPGSFSWEANNSRAIFTPADPLEDFAAFHASVGTGATDVSGNPLESEYSWSFETGEGGTVTGTISYSPFIAQGESQVYGGVFIGLFRQPCFFEPDVQGWSEALGPYTVEPVPPGTYYVAAALDVNGNEDIDLGEPAGMYDPGQDGSPDPVVVTAGKTTRGIDLSLDLVYRLCTISGTVSKRPEVTESDTTYALFFMEDPTAGGEADPWGMAVLPNGTGPYVSTPLPFGCYYIICFMDLNGNGELDFVGEVPSEPVGIYGEVSGQGEPVLTPVFVVDDVTDIDMTLFYFDGPTVPPFSLSRMRAIVPRTSWESGFRPVR